MIVSLGCMGKRIVLLFSALYISLLCSGQAQLFTSNGSFTAPAGVTSVLVECWGGGGAGGAATGNAAAGGGGAGGAYSMKVVTVVPGTSYTITVGSGATGGTGAGPSGGPSWFGTVGTVYAEGGTGGALASVNNSNGTGGTGSNLASIGDLTYKGGNGSNGNFTAGTPGGAGGGGAGSTGNGNNAATGTGGAAKSNYGGAGANGVANSTSGSTGSTYGGGGSGGKANSLTDRNGGSGANGLVVVTTATLGFGFERNITVDYTKVIGGKDLYNFPMLINLGAQTFLKNSPAGQILNINGYDIIFTDVNYNQLDHQIEYYNGTNGDLIAWVRIPVLSCTANTVIKMLYSNPQVTTDQSVTSVWDSHYKGVWHFDNNNLNDFTSFNKSGTPFNTPTYLAGRINNALGLNGSNEYVEVDNDPNINITGNLTVSAWVYLSALGLDQKIASNQNNVSGGYKFGVYTNNKLEFEIRNSSNTPSLNRDEPGGTTLTTGQWYYFAGICSDVLDSIKTFVNGNPERPFKKTGTLGLASDNLVISKEPFESNYYFNGRFDELRISNEVRSNGWIKTEYNSQSGLVTFYTVDAVAGLLNFLPSASTCDGPITLTFGFPAGGVYSGNPNITGNIFTPAGAGTYPIQYTYNGCTVTKNFIITSTPVAPAAVNKAYCSSQITYLEATSGQNIQWYYGGTLVSNANPFSTGQNTPGTYNYTVTQSVNGCESAATPVTLTVYNGITITTQPLPGSICAGGDASFTVAASGYNLTYQWQEGGVNITNGGIYSGATTATLNLTNPGVAKNGKVYRCVITSPCGPSTVNSNNATLTVSALPVATFSYTGTPYCPNAANPSPTFSGGGVAGTFSSTAGLVFVSTATGQVNIASSTPGSYTVTNTLPSAGPCGIITASSPIVITSNLIWSGTASTDWNTPANWLCGCIPNPGTSAQIIVSPRQPVLSTGAVGRVNNLIIDPGTTLTVTGNTIQISGTITNNGTFNASAGVVTLNGSAAQTIGVNIFSGNTIKDLIINNPANVTLLGPLNITGVVTLQSGNLLSGGNLILVSTAAQTALISGTGSGNVTGNVTMQRYLTSGFGYKYISSPFQAATVNEFADDITLGSFTFYRYDENRTASGWVGYSLPTTNILNPLQGYIANFGAVNAPNTFDITGLVNSGNLSVTLYNHNYIYTKGFNLAGNPYPSPIDWNAAGWTKINIDNAIYYFKSSTIDQYGGTYSSYINGISSDGLVNNIIPSMQGFYVHVTDGAYPVSATLALNNSVRIADLTHSFTKGTSSIPHIRFTSAFADDSLSSDPAVIYFDEKATPNFDSQLDALKILNTDLTVPNLYSVNPDGAKLSINALPPFSDDSLTIPIGLKANRTGSVVFKIKDIDESLKGMKFYFIDNVAGIRQDLFSDSSYKVSLEKGEYDERFLLTVADIPTSISENTIRNDLFDVYSSHGKMITEINFVEGMESTIKVFDLQGILRFVRNIYVTGHYEFDPGIIEGIYVVKYTTGLKMSSKKIFIDNR